MKTILLSLITFFCFDSFSQSIIAPTWDKSNIYFETAKIKVKNTTNDTYGPEQFKTSFIKIENIDLGVLAVTIDIPDKYFGKEFFITKTSYEITPGELEVLSYILETKDNKDMVGLSFYYHAGDNKPFQIFINVHENFNGKAPKKHAYILSEFK